MQLKTLGEQTTLLALAYKKLESSAVSIAVVKDAVKGLNIANTMTVISSLNLSKAETKEILIAKGVTEAKAEEIIANYGLAASEEGATFATIGLSNALKGLWATIIANPLLLITSAIVAMVTVISKVKQAKEELHQSVQEITKDFQSQENTLKSSHKKLDDIIPKFEKLSKGVNALGQNVSLSIDEYEEYKEIINQIADMFPTMIQGYNDEGIAILECKGDVDELTEAYLNLIRAKNDAVLSEGTDIFKDFNSQRKEFEKSNHQNTKMTDRANKALQNILNAENLDEAIEKYAPIGTTQYVQIINALKDAGLKTKNEMKWYNPTTWADFEMGTDFIKRAIQENKSVVDGIVGNYDSQMQEAAEGMKTITSAYLSNAFVGAYKDISSELQSFITAITSSFDYDFYAQFENIDDLYSYLSNMLSVYRELDDGTFTTALDVQTKFNNGECSVGEYLSNLAAIKSIMSSLDEESQKAISILFNLEDDDIETRIDTILSKATLDHTQGSKNAFADWLNSLSSDDLNIVYKISTEYTDENVQKQLKLYQEGGNVNLTLRPKVDTSELRKAGWDETGDYATVLTSTYSNKAGNIAINFTPIMTDEKGNYIGTLSPDELQKYAEAVIDGTQEDYLHLQIGARFTGEDAITQAVDAAELIHRYQAFFYDIGDPSEFGLGEWQEILDEFKETDVSGKLSFADLFVDTESDTDFHELVDNYIDKVTDLTSAFDKFSDNKLTNEDIGKLIKEFPELAKYSDNLGDGIKYLINQLTYGKDEAGNLTGIYGTFLSQFGNLETDEDRQQLESYMKTVLALGEVVGTTKFELDIDTEIDDMDKFYTAMKESVTSTGLTADSIKNLKERYKDLNNFNASALFERTANGIHLNTKALRELESEYENQKKSQIQEDLSGLVDKYNDLTKKINNCTDAKEAADLYTQRQNILDRINDTADLAAQYDGLTSAFHKWEQAQSIGEEGDMYDALTGGLENIKELYEQGLIGTNKFRTAVQLMSNVDLSTASVEELIAAYEKGYDKMTRYFQEGSDGCVNFLQDVQILNSEWAHMNANGDWEINFGVGNDQKVADALGINVESVQAIMRKLSDYGFDINLDSIYDKLDLAISKAEKANDKLKELGKTDYTFNLSTTSIEAVNDELSKAQELYDSFRNNDGSLSVELEGAAEAEEILTALLAHKHSLEEPAIMQVDTGALPEASADLTNAIDLLQQFITLSNDLEDGIAKGIDTKNTQSEIQNVATQLDALPADVKTKLGLDSEDFSKAITNIKNEKNVVNIGVSVGQDDITTVQKTISGITGTDIEILTNSAVVKRELEEVDEYDIGDKSFAVGISNNPIDELNNINNYQIQDKHYTIYTTTVGESDARGTAYAKGDWGTKKDGVALGGEVGQELVVRDGKFFTIGEDSAELFTYRKGDIIFNAEQTKQILANGKITNGKKRGVSYAEGTAFSSGSGKIRGAGTVVVVPSDDGSGDSTPSGFSSSESKDSEKYIDRVAIKLDRLHRKIEEVATTINNTFAIWGKRNSSITSQISNITHEIGVQGAAAERYLEEANRQIEKYGLNMDWVHDIQNGGIAFSYLTNLDELYEGYQEYQKWYEKYLDCKQQEKELTVELSQLYKNYFDNIQQNFENQIELNEYLRDENEKTYTASTEYFSEMRTIQQKNLNLLIGELTMLQTQLNRAVDSGAIEKGSEAWQEMQSAINGVKKSISETNVELAKLYTEQFKYIQSGYKNQMALYESLNDANEKNFTTNTNYFSEMRKIQKKNLSALTNELSDLEEQFAIAMDSGKIEEGSEAWYEMQQAIDDVKREISSTKVELKQLYLDNFSYIEDGFKNQLSLYEYYSNIYSKKSTLLETQGYMSSSKLLSMQQNIQKKNISILNEELATLEKELTRAMDTGKIEQYSSAWYSMTASINSVKEALYDANIEVEKLNKSMRQLDWDEFDLQQEMASQLTDESDFLINIMSYTDLYDKKGRLTDTGIATMGLHNLNADAYKKQSQDYLLETTLIDLQLYENPNNTDLLKRKQELLKLQRELVIAMENEQKAIISMVENGIKIELDALKELIDTYKEALDSEKDLYDYQNQVADKSKDIATIQKQLSAYTNDTSEETRATVQKLQVDLSKAQKDLQETEYSRSISDQKKLLDDLYNEYELFLNTRLDDTNKLLEDMRLVTNALPQEIGDILRPVAESVSMHLSEGMNGIWNDAAVELKRWNDNHENEQQITRDTLNAADASWGTFGKNLRGSVISKFSDVQSDVDDESKQIKTAVGQNALGIDRIFLDLETRKGQIVANNNANTQSIKDIITEKDNSANINKNFTTTNDALKKIEKYVEEIRKETEKEAAFYIGDVDMDGKVTSSDSLKVLRASVGLEKLDDVQMKLADVDGDGKITSSDALEILRRSVGLSQNIKSYSTGGLADYTGIANIHGTKDKPELVLNANDTQNFLSLKDLLREMAKNHTLDLAGSYHGIELPELQLAKLPTVISGFNNSSAAQDIHVTNNINIDHVLDYDDIVNKLRTDKKFDKVLWSKTVGKLNGGTEMDSYKYKW